MVVVVCQKLTHFNDFWHVLRQFDMKILQICPPHLSDVATLPWEIQKVILQQYY